jgi:hypothetical protein
MAQISNSGAVTFWEQDSAGDLHRKIGSVPAEYANAVRDFIRLLAAQGDGGARGEEVWVIDLDEAEFAKARASNPSILPIENEQVFPSGMHASVAVGYKTNEVATRLSKEKSRQVAEATLKSGPEAAAKMRYRPSVKLRGVTFQYERDVRFD